MCYTVGEGNNCSTLHFHPYLVVLTLNIDFGTWLMAKALYVLETGGCQVQSPAQAVVLVFLGRHFTCITSNHPGVMGTCLDSERIIIGQLCSAMTGSTPDCDNSQRVEK